MISKQGGVSYNRAGIRLNWFESKSRFESIQGEERGDAHSFRDLTIASKLSRGEPVALVILEVGHVHPQVLLQDYIHPLSLAVRLRMPDGGQLYISIQQLAKVSPESRYKLGASIGHYSFRQAIQSPDVISEQAGQSLSIAGPFAGDQSAELSKSVDYY